MTRRDFGVTLVAVLLVVSGLRAHDDFRVVGAIVALDAGQRVLTVRMIPQPGDDESAVERKVPIALPDWVTTEKDRKPVPLNALEPGLWVVVDAQGHDYTDLEAVKVRIVPPPPTR